MPFKTEPEFKAVGDEYEDAASFGPRFSRLFLAVLLGFLALMILGSWSLTHQISYDPQPASARLAVFQKIQHLQVVPLDVEIVLRQNAAERWILGDGFRQPEKDGVWISALRSSINFSVDSGTRSPRSLALTLFPLLGPTRPSRTLTISSDGSTVTKTISTLDVVTIPLNGEIKQTINISCDSVDSPLSLRVGPDNRVVCAKLISIVVKST